MQGKGLRVKIRDFMQAVSALSLGLLTCRSSPEVMCKGFRDCFGVLYCMNLLVRAEGLSQFDWIRGCGLLSL